MTENRYISLIPKIKQKFILNLLKENKRIDNRKFYEYRPIKIKVGDIPNAEGSALVNLGNTVVLAGVKVSVTNPYLNEPNKGTLVVNAEFPPVASPDFEPGPPDENAIELARIIDRGLRKPEVVDFSKLCIIEGKKVYGIWIDIYVLNHDGNLIDASGIATLAALLTTKYKKVEVTPSGEIKETGELIPLEIKNIPIYMSYVKIKDYIILDPNLEEEAISDAYFTVIISSNYINGIQKGGKGGFKVEDIHEIIKNSFKISENIKNIILSVKQW